MRATQNISIAGTATLAPIPIFVAEQDGFLRAADWSCFGATDGAKTAILRNATQNINLTALLTINGLAALARTPFVMATTNALIKKGDVITVTYTVGTAGTVAPGETSIGLIVDDPAYVGIGPAWAG
jgi:hypothetical protein